VYLLIDDDKIELRDALALWGRGAIAVEKELKEKFGDEFQIAVIGPGGENGVSFASINHDYGRQAGRGGVGTVMGVKKVKAIVVHGTQPIPVANVADYREAGLALFKACKDAGGLKEWQTYGTTIVVSWCDEVGALPTRNFSAGSFEGGKTLYGPVMRKEIVITDKGCFGCPSPCGKYSRVKRYNSNVEGPEYETIGMLGSNVGLSDIQDVAQANLLCDDLGIDTISTGGAIGWAMECYEKGLLTQADTDGLELKFGNVEAVFKLIGQIARREGLGALLAEGVKKASGQVGRGSERFAIGPGAEQRRAHTMLRRCFGVHEDVARITRQPSPTTCRWAADAVPEKVARSSGCKTFAQCSTCSARVACSGSSWALTATCTRPRSKRLRASGEAGKTWKRWATASGT
jgi:aldehyde:ferredoxin oxidoreductase